MKMGFHGKGFGRWESAQRVHAELLAHIRRMLAAR